MTYRALCLQMTSLQPYKVSTIYCCHSTDEETEAQSSSHLLKVINVVRWWSQIFNPDHLTQPDTSFAHPGAHSSGSVQPW